MFKMALVVTTWLWSVQCNSPLIPLGPYEYKYCMHFTLPSIVMGFMKYPVGIRLYLHHLIWQIIPRRSLWNYPHSWLINVRKAYLKISFLKLNSLNIYGLLTPVINISPSFCEYWCVCLHLFGLRANSFLKNYLRYSHVPNISFLNYGGQISPSSSANSSCLYLSTRSLSSSKCQRINQH